MGAVLNIVLARIWYGLFFKGPWRGLTNRTLDEKPSRSQMSVAIVLALAMSVGVNMITSVLQIDRYGVGAVVGLVISLLFIAPPILGEWIWDKKQLKLFVLNAGFYVTYFMCTFMLAIFLREF